MPAWHGLRPVLVLAHYSSTLQQHLPRSLAALDVPVRLRGLCQRILTIDAKLELSFRDPAEQIACAPGDLLGTRHMCVERGPRQEQRSLLRKIARVERLDLTA